MRPERTCSPSRVHDIEPATFERAALIRDWLDDLGVDRVTLLVIPARDLHPLSDRRPEVGTWLLERVEHGDAIAQHGFCHLQSRHAALAAATRSRRRQRGAASSSGSTRAQTVRALDAGRRVLKLAGIEPRGFVAPAYAYTPQLRESLRDALPWWAGTWALHPTRAGAPRLPLRPPIGLAARRAAAPRGLARAAARRRARRRDRRCGSTCTRSISPRRATCSRSRT